MLKVLGELLVRLNRDVIINAIIKHQYSFLKLLDFIDKQEGVPEIPEKLYIDLYIQYICEDDDPNVHAQLSLKSLLENGVFIHHDKNSGSISISDVVINLLRFVDVKRARELTHYELENLRQLVSDYTDKLLTLSIQSSQDTKDLNGSFYRLLSEIHSKIKENVSALSAQVNKVSQQYTDFNAGNSSTSVFELYDCVTELYGRYVLPCYEFIDPFMEMKGKRTFTQSIKMLIEHLATTPNGLHASNRLQYRFTAISSYYKDIGALVRKLKQYSTYLAKDRDRFIAIENAYAVLMDDLVPLRHGKQKNKYLTPYASLFQTLTILDGLREHTSNHAPRFNWFDGKTALRFKEYLALLNNSDQKATVGSIKPLPADIRLEEDRQIEIAKLIAQTELPERIEDLHAYILELLSTHLSKFWLGDVLFGLQEFMPHAAQETFIYSEDKRRQQDANYYLNYLNIELQRG